MLKVYSCCMGGNVEKLDFLRPIISKLEMELIVISEWEQHDIKWNLKTWLTELSKADIIVCVQHPESQSAKSNGRVTQAMSLGIPVIASPLNAYVEAIENNRTGFICNAPEEWEEKLTLLRDDFNLRKCIGNAAKLASQQFYSIDKVGSYWLHVFSKLSEEASNPPKVDIIIPTWNNLKYLQECIKSIRLHTPYPHNIIVINSGKDETQDWLNKQSDIIHHTHNERLHFSAANNIGLSLSKEKYVCFLNDDTIVCDYWLEALMHEATKGRIVNPFSNCDKGWLHNEDWYEVGLTLDQVKIEDVYKKKHEKVLTEREWLPFFCTVLPREAIDKVGKLDENFKSGCEDVDYCRRLKKLGYKFYTTYDSVVFHFGGTSRKNAEKVSFQQHHDEDIFNQTYLQNKEKRKICFYLGEALESWSPESLETGIGGSETMAVLTAKEFAHRGYQVKVYAEANGFFDNVEYIHHSKFDHHEVFDIFISSRQSNIFNIDINARKKICWVHDIWLHADNNANINQDKIDKYFVLSPWHKQFFMQHHKVPEHKIYLTHNFIDHKRFNKKLERITGQMIYSSSPDRGLDVLLTIFPRIKEKIPEAKLKIYYGFDNWELACKLRNDQNEINHMNNIKSMLNQNGVEYYGRTGQTKLAEEFLQSSLWFYPTSFTETSCCTAMEAMCAGCPCVATNLAALSTTIGEGGVLINADPYSQWYQDMAVEVCCKILTDPILWQNLSLRGKNKVKNYTVEKMVDAWEKELI